jgi:sec-independent protein translocase protein TatA
MHLIVLLVIVLLVFGPGKLPELGKAVGDGLRELKKATGGEDKDKDKTEAAHAAASTSTVTPIGATAPAPTMASRPCPSCRGAVPVGDKFCGNCGTTLEVVSRSA